jgi:hypothetical protein
MNSIVSESAAEPLVFSWDSPQRGRLAITLFLALSLLAHAICFYIFQIVYPPTIALLPPPARVTFITPASEEGRTLLRWVDSEDPALAFTTRRPSEARLPALPKAEHVPSYSAIQPTLKEIPPLERDLRIPSCQAPGAVRLDRQKATRAMGAFTTYVSFSSELEVFGAPTLPEQNFVASNEQAPQTVRFRVAINKLGEIRYCFPINSSGDPALDQQARLYVARCRFSKSAAGPGKADSFLAWGVAAIEWGNDIASPQPRGGATATP